MADELSGKLPERYILVQIVTQKDRNPYTVIIPIDFDGEAWDDALLRVIEQVRAIVYRAQAQHWRQVAGGG